MTTKTADTTPASPSAKAADGSGEGAPTVPPPHPPRPERGDILTRVSRRLTANVWVQAGALVLAVLLVVIPFMVADFGEDYSRLDNVMLSGPQQGNYYAQVAELSEEVAAQQGKLANVVTNGSVENLQRLVAARDACEVQFAMVQDGLQWPHEGGISLLGRLGKAESVFFLTHGPTDIHLFSQLRDMTIGIGPGGSGTAQLAREIFESSDFAKLGLELREMSYDAQLDELANKKLGMAVFAIDEDSTFIANAVRARGMSLVSFDHLDVIARKLPHARKGRIGAGQFDPVAVLPESDKFVLRVGTLIVSNGCASRSETMTLMRLLTAHYPDFVAENAQGTNTTRLPLDETAQSFYREGGTGFVDNYFPWIVDIMPLGNWVYIIMSFSVLFNFMGAGHRFRLWRIDANRVMLEEEVQDLLGKTVTLMDLTEVDAHEKLNTAKARRELNRLIERLARLKSRCRNQSVSMLVPMGAEMAYRHQEILMDKLLDALDTIDDRLQEQSAQAA